MLVAVPGQIGYAALFGFVFAESAGVPVPAEAPLIAAGLLARSGHLSLPLVIAVGAVAAILGDNVGYLLGRRGGRAFLLRDGFAAGHRRRAAAHAERFFDRWGVLAVFLGRWIAGVRLVSAVFAGASAMPWRRFLVANALGGVAWSASVCTMAAVVGPVGAAIMYGAGLVAAAATALLALIRARRRSRTAPAARPAGTRPV